MPQVALQIQRSKPNPPLAPTTGQKAHYWTNGQYTRQDAITGVLPAKGIKKGAPGRSKPARSHARRKASHVRERAGLATRDKADARTTEAQTNRIAKSVKLPEIKRQARKGARPNQTENLDGRQREPVPLCATFCATPAP